MNIYPLDNLGHFRQKFNHFNQILFQRVQYTGIFVAYKINTVSSLGLTERKVLVPWIQQKTQMTKTVVTTVSFLEIM